MKEKISNEYAEMVWPLLSWYDKGARKLPWREKKDPYSVWVSEIMLQQTRVETVLPYYRRFMEAFPTIQMLAGADEEDVLKIWEGLGYYSRARNLKKAAIKICEEFGGVFPEVYEDMLSLPGIGKYTAGAVSSIAFGMPRAAIDGNVLRVVTRFQENGGNIKNEKFRTQIREKLEAIYPKGYCSEFTQSMMELGAVICIPNGYPKCKECPLSRQCKAYKNGTQSEYPKKSEKMQRKKVQKTVLLLHCEEKIAVRKRDEGGLLGGMWQFPNTDIQMGMGEIKKWLNEQKIVASSIQKYKNVRHVFTHLEWDMYCYNVQCSSKNENYKWVSREELEDTIPIPIAFRKCL